MGLPNGEEIMTIALSVLITIPVVTDEQTDGHVAVASTRSTHIVSRVKGDGLRLLVNFIQY